MQKVSQLYLGYIFGFNFFPGYVHLTFKTHLMVTIIFYKVLKVVRFVFVVVVCFPFLSARDCTEG